VGGDEGDAAKLDRGRAQLAVMDHLGIGRFGGGIKPEIPDLTRSQPHPCRHDREGFVPGEDLSPARSDNLS